MHTTADTTVTLVLTKSEALDLLQELGEIGALTDPVDGPPPSGHSTPRPG